MSSKSHSINEETCARCGQEALGVVGDEALCETCYHQAGSCCGEYGVQEEEAETQGTFTPPGKCDSGD